MVFPEIEDIEKRYLPMKDLKNFFTTVGHSLNPWSYDKLADRVFNKVLKYFFSLLFLAFFIMILIAIPKIITLPNYLSNEFMSFEKLEIKINQSMTEPITLSQNMPLITIDTITDYENITTLEKEKGKLLINNKKILFKPFFKTRIYMTEDYENLLDNSDQLNKIITIIVIMMLPMLLILLFVCFFIKFALMILIGSVLAFVITRLIKFEITFAETLKVGIFASTLMILGVLLTLPHSIETYYIPYIIFLLYLILGTINAGGFTSKRMKIREKKPIVRHKS
ncbi:DUF1189 family protein [Nanoarchaeota archaeon]